MLKTLQAGRALAAVSVAAFHLSIAMALPRYGGIGVFREFTKRGNLGVDFFFILSGFIIIFAHQRDLGRPAQWLTYAYRRFVRLFPIYWLYSGVFALLLLTGIGTEASAPTGFWDILTSVTLVRFTAASPPLAPAWTLFHEFAFYAVFSLAILNRRMGFMAIAAWVLGCMLLYHYPAEDARNAFNVYTSAYSAFFAMGMGAFWLYRRGGTGLVEAGIGAVILALMFFVVTMETSFSKPAVVLGFTLLIAGATKLEKTYDLSVPKVLTAIGDASYTIYLTHIALEGLFLKIAMKTPIYGMAGPVATYILTLCGTILAGYIAYYLVERPLLDRLRGRGRKGEPQPAVLPTPENG